MAVIRPCTISSASSRARPEGLPSSSLSVGPNSPTPIARMMFSRMKSMIVSRSTPTSRASRV